MKSKGPVAKNLAFKIVLVGESWTGKSNLFLRITRDKFNLDTYGTIGASFAIQSVTSVDHKPLSGELWDISGRPSYWELSASHVRGALGALLVFDITNRESFEKLYFWLAKIRDIADPSVVIALLGNKSDLDVGSLREVSALEAVIFAADNGLQGGYAEVSALTGCGVKEAYQSVLSGVYVATVSAASGGEGVDAVDHMSIDCNSEAAPVGRLLEHNESADEGDRGRALPQKKTSGGAGMLHMFQWEHRPPDPESSAGQGHRHVAEYLLDAAGTSPHTPVTATARPVRLSGIAGVYGTFVNGVYSPTSSQHCGMPIYRRMIQQPGVVESKQKQTPQDMFLVFHDSYKPKSKLGVPHGAWLVQTRAGKVYARAVLPLRAPPCYPQELYMSPDGKYRREDVVWEMKSSVKVFGFRVRPAGAVHLVDLDLGMAEKERPLVAAMPAIAELDPDTDRSSGLEDYEIISAEAEPAPTARVILVGDSAVGKTSLVSRFLRDTLDDSYLDTISVDISWREAETLDGRPVKCQLWDCSGTPRNWPLVGVYLRNPSTMPSGVVLCYDTTRRDSFENVALWLQRLLDFPPLRASRNFHLVATKCDMEHLREVSFDEGVGMVQLHNLRSFVETSAASGQGVDSALQNVLTEVLHGPNLRLGDPTIQKNGGRRQTVHTLMPSHSPGTAATGAGISCPEESEQESSIEIELAGRRKSFDYSDLANGSSES